jgi:hypothetical protein
MGLARRCRMVEESMDRSLMAYREGRTTFGELMRATRKRWERLALGVIRRWRPPAWFTKEDAVQEMLAAVDVLVWDWLPEKGASISKFVTWNAVNETKYAVHAARGVSLHGSPDKVKSVIERPMSSFRRQYEDGDEDAIESVLAEAGFVTQAAHEERVEQRERVQRALAACDSIPEMVSIREIERAGTIEGGARAIWADRNKRALCRVTSEVKAAELVARSAVRVASRIEASARGVGVL